MTSGWEKGTSSYNADGIRTSSITKAAGRSAHIPTMRGENVPYPSRRVLPAMTSLWRTNIIRSDIAAIITTSRQSIITSRRGTTIPNGVDSSMRTRHYIAI